MGNLEHAFRDAYDRAYRPFLDIIRRRREVRASLHYSGSLLQWIERNRPEFLDDLSALVREGRVELLTGGFYEPILPIIPDRDKAGQISLLTSYLQERLGADPKGMWLPERVWDSRLVAPLRAADVRYTLVDDNNFRRAGIADHESADRFQVRGPDGQTLDVFAINSALRRSVPFQPPETAMEHVRRLAESGGALAVLADDGEKLGEWPGTHKTVYEERWLERFFDLLAGNRGWVRMTTLSEAVTEMEACGPIELPAGSYEEMMRWSGGRWEHFLERYEESHLMYRKMLLVSGKLAERRETDTDGARDGLYRGQANDAYWHGTFGGLYLLHLRQGNYRSLLEAENELARDGRVRIAQQDFDGDGAPEVLVRSPQLSVYLHRIGGQAFELADRAKPWNLAGALMRRPEPYHERLGDTEQGRRLLPLHYDWYPRRALIDHFLRDDVDLDAFARCEYGEQGDFVNQPFEFDIKEYAEGGEVTLRRRGGVWVGDSFLPVTVSKTLCFAPDSPQIRCDYQVESGAEQELDLWFASEQNFVLSGARGDGRYYRVNSDGGTSPLDARREFEDVARFEMVDERLGEQVTLELEDRPTVWTFPIMTVSQGLEGPTSSYQGSSVSAHWPVRVSPGRPWHTSFTITLGAAGGATPG